MRLAARLDRLHASAVVDRERGDTGQHRLHRLDRPCLHTQNALVPGARPGDATPAVATAWAAPWLAIAGATTPGRRLRYPCAIRPGATRSTRAGCRSGRDLLGDPGHDRRRLADREFSRTATRGGPGCLYLGLPDRAASLRLRRYLGRNGSGMARGVVGHRHRGRPANPGHMGGNGAGTRASPGPYGPARTAPRHRRPVTRPSNPAGRRSNPGFRHVVQAGRGAGPYDGTVILPGDGLCPA